MSISKLGHRFNFLNFALTQLVNHIFNVSVFTVYPNPSHKHDNTFKIWVANVAFITNG